MLTIKALNFSYSNERKIFSDFFLSIDRGEFVCLEGGNGAGKTTLLNIISGLNYSPDMELQFLGENVTQEELQKAIVYVPTKPEFYEELNVDDYIQLVSILWKMEKGFNEKVYENLKSIGLEINEQQAIGDFSLGMQYKLYLSVFLAIPRKILLLDEPFNALDIKSRKIAIQMVKDYVECNNGLCIFSSHVNETISQLKTRTISLN